MIKLDTLLNECTESLHMMTPEEFALFNQKAIANSRDSYLLGDLDEDELISTGYRKTPVQSFSSQRRLTWTHGMYQSFALVSRATEYSCERMMVYG